MIDDAPSANGRSGRGHAPAPPPSAEARPVGRPDESAEAARHSRQAAVLRRLKIVLSSLAIVLGLTTIVLTFAAGGGPAARGVLLGAVLAVMGALRLYLTVRHEV